MRIKDAIAEFLLHYQLNGKVSFRAYRPALEKFLLHAGVRRMKDIRVPQTTDRVCSALLSSSLDNNSVWHAMTVIKIFLRYFQDQGVISVNLRNVSVPKRVHKRQRAVKQAEHDRILESVDVSSFVGVRDVALLMMLFDTGMRVSELVNVRLADIDFETDTCRVRTAKTHAEDIVCWSEATTDWLLDVYMPIRMNLRCTKEFLFVGKVSANGWWKDGITRRAVERIVRHHSRKCGYDDITPHKYRHGKAYAIHEKGGTLADIRNVLRHSSLESALSYLRMFERDDTNRMKKFL